MINVVNEHPNKIRHVRIALSFGTIIECRHLLARLCFLSFSPMPDDCARRAGRDEKKKNDNYCYHR